MFYQSKPKKEKIIIQKILKQYTKKIEKLNNLDIKKINDFKPDILVNLAWQGIPDFSYQMCIRNEQNHFKFLYSISKIKTIKKLL